MVSASDIYTQNNRLALVFTDTVITDRIIRILRHHHIFSVPIKTEDEIAAALEFKPVKPIISEELKEKAVTGIRHLFEAVLDDSPNNMTTAYHAVRELDEVVDKLVDTLAAESRALVHIADLKSYDEYTFHHSLSVAVLSIAIGQGLNLSDDELRLLGRTALMHDIGKILIPAKIINKPSRLTKKEFALMKKHSELGHNFLSKGNIGDDMLRRAVLSHHEKADGRGYPEGVRGDDIPFFAKIISVADVYDAVTSYRSYRMPMPPSEALEIIMGDIGSAFEYEIVKTFIEKLEFYPVNTCVELSDGRRGVVTDNANIMRPVLTMFDTGEKLDLLDFNNLTLIITRVVDNHADR